MSDIPTSRGPVEVRTWDGKFDELIAHDVAGVHIETMDDKTLWIGIDLLDGTRWTMFASSRCNLECSVKDKS